MRLALVLPLRMHWLAISTSALAARLLARLAVVMVTLAITISALWVCAQMPVVIAAYPIVVLAPQFLARPPPLAAAHPIVINVLRLRSTSLTRCRWLRVMASVNRNR